MARTRTPVRLLVMTPYAGAFAAGTTISLLALALAAGCHRVVPPPPAPRVELTAAAEARKNLVASGRIADLEGLLGKVDTVATKLGLPFKAAEARQTLVAKSGWPEVVVSKLDVHQPIAVAAVSLVVAAGPPHTVVVGAASLKDGSAAGAAAFIAAAGKTIRREKDAVLVEGVNAGHDKIWLLCRQGAVLAAESLEALVAGGELALSARQRPADGDLTVRAFPEAIARASGTDLKTAVAKMKTEMADIQGRTRERLAGAEGKNQTQAATDRLAQQMVGFIADTVAETQEAELGIGVDPTRGLTVTTIVRPAAGSAFARRTAQRGPYQIDPGLLAGEPPVGLWAAGENGFVSAMFEATRTTLLVPLVGPRDRDRVVRSFDTVTGALAGPWSGAARIGPGPKMSFTYDLIYRLKAGSDGAALLAAVEELTRGPWLGQLLAMGSGGTMAAKIKTKREADVVTTMMTLDARKLPAEARAKLADVPFFNGKPVEASVTVAGDRLVMAMGDESKRRLPALRAAPATPPAGDLAAALAETRGADGLYFVDAAAALRPALSVAAASSGDRPGFTSAVLGMVLTFIGQTHLTTYLSYQGGGALTITWRTPMGTFESAARLFRTVTGGAPPAAPTQPL
jgi:hypothetical protein